MAIYPGLACNRHFVAVVHLAKTLYKHTTSRMLSNIYVSVLMPSLKKGIGVTCCCTQLQNHLRLPHLSSALS